MRVGVVGLPGSGKSTLAAALSQKLEVPHIHLDRFWFEAGGLTSSPVMVRPLVRQKVQEAIEQPGWVADGLYLHVQDLIAPRTEKIVFLDIPLWERLANHARRVFFEKRHRELGLHHELAFFCEIVRRQFKSKQKLLAFVAQQGDKVTALHSRKEVEQFLDSISGTSFS